MNRIQTSVGALMLAALVACSAPSSTPPVSEVPLAPDVMHPHALTITGTYTAGITVNSSIQGMVTGPDGRIWFGEFNASNVGAITTSGVAHEYPTSGGVQPIQTIQGPQANNLWSAGYGGTFVRSLTSGTQHNYATVSGGHIADMVVGPDHNIWFTDYGNNKAGRVTPTGVVTEFALPASAHPWGIASNNGFLWIADSGNLKVIKMNTSGTVLASYGGFTAGESLENMVRAPDGNVYVTESAFSSVIKDNIARVSPTGKVTELASMTYGGYPNRLAIGKDKNVYFVFQNRKTLGKLNTSTGKVALFSMPYKNDHGADAITAGPDGRLWIGGFYTIYAVSY